MPCCAGTRVTDGTDGLGAHCTVCTAPLPPHRQKYCSDKCRTKRNNSLPARRAHRAAKAKERQAPGSPHREAYLEYQRGYTAAKAERAKERGTPEQQESDTWTGNDDDVRGLFGYPDDMPPNQDRHEHGHMEGGRFYHVHHEGYVPHGHRDGHIYYIGTEDTYVPKHARRD